MWADAQLALLQHPLSLSLEAQTWGSFFTAGSASWFNALLPPEGSGQHRQSALAQPVPGPDHVSQDKGSNFSWKGVEEQVAAGLILLAACGIGFIAWTVPRQLDLVLQAQKTFTERIVVIEGRLVKVEGDVQGLDRRTTRLEARP